MTKRDLEKVLKNAFSLLSAALPQRAYLLGPLLYGAALWAVRRPETWKENIFGWRIWPRPGAISVKPDEFILFFFRSHDGLAAAFQPQIEKKRMAPLREAFGRLYPVLGLGDPFLTALFREELEAGDYQRIIRDFEKRLDRARRDIEEMPDRRLFRILGDFVEELLGLGMTLLDETKFRIALSDLLRRKPGETE